MELEKLSNQLEERAAQALDIAQAEAALPNDEDIARIQRYEGASEREFYRALNHLQRMQRLPHGEGISPRDTPNGIDKD